MWSGEGLCDCYLETFEEMLKPLSVDTNYLECGHKLGSNSSLFGGWIYLTLLTHSQVERLMVQKSMFTPCLCSPDDDYKQERQGGGSTASLSRGGCSWSSLGHLLSISRVYW